MALETSQLPLKYGLTSARLTWIHIRASFQKTSSKAESGAIHSLGGKDQLIPRDFQGSESVFKSDYFGIPWRYILICS
jgi:hypothetical protein